MLYRRQGYRFMAHVEPLSARKRTAKPRGSAIGARTVLPLGGRQAGRSTRGIRDDDSLRGKKLGRQAGSKGCNQGQQYRSEREEWTPRRIDVGNMIRTGEKEVVNESKHERAGAQLIACTNWAHDHS
jgi:hypothetical protein